MANNSENILSKARQKGLATPAAGMSAPDGYFEDFNARMAAMLPERPEVESTAADEGLRDTSLWFKVRPYVYMAAMFAGIWCMLQIFTSVTDSGKLRPISENAVLAKALASDDFVMDYVYDDINSWDIVDEMMDDSTVDDNIVLDVITDSDSDISGDYILPQ